MIRRLLLIIFSVFMLAGCATYKSHYTGFRPPSDYMNSQIVSGATVGAEAFADAKAAKQAFGFDIKKAGLLPVQVVMDNKSGGSMVVISGQTFLVDNSNRYWQLIPNEVAVDRVAKATSAGEIASGAGKSAVLGAAGGAILGAAFGILTGENVAAAAGKGAALGGAGGAVIGGGQKISDPQHRWTISDDIKEKGLEGKPFPDQSLANGFLFFPAEAKTAKELRLQLKDASGAAHNLILPF
ncbi:MAG: hypothetical protein KQH63_13670 [Desulfobulbaceae bacterium]|nr:hypothetical protein [Desulfobulbaceae bacterium]